MASMRDLIFSLDNLDTSFSLLFLVTNQTMAGEEEEAAVAKLERFLQWLQVNKVELRGCNVKYYGKNKGFGVFSSNDVSEVIKSFHQFRHLYLCALYALVVDC